MDNWNRSIEEITPAWRDVLRYLPEEDRVRVQEIRMRALSPLLLSLTDGLWYLRTDSRLTRCEEDPLIMCDRRGVEDTFLRLCGYAIHAHEGELQQGFVRAENGCRCGIAGDMVTQEGQVRSFRKVTGLCLRIAREHPGCANELVRELYVNDCPRSLLICGEPASGKTSLLRDLARQLSDPVKGKGLRVAVVDERGELAGLDTLHNCDVLTGCPKPAGIMQAIRCLSPDVVLFDELGGTKEIEAIRQGLRCGVAVIASIHAPDSEALWRRKAVRELLEDGAFSQIAFLEGRRSPCKVRCIYSDEEWRNAVCGISTADIGRRKLRIFDRDTTAASGTGVGNNRVLDKVSSDGVSFSRHTAGEGAGSVCLSTGVSGAHLSAGIRHAIRLTGGATEHGDSSASEAAGANSGGCGDDDSTVCRAGGHGS